MAFEPNTRLEVIHFGKYDWLVLEREKDHMLLLMKDVLEEEQSYFTGEISQYTFTLWDACYLREWLNKDFYSTFTPEEQARILKTGRNNDAYSSDCEYCEYGDEQCEVCDADPDGWRLYTYSKIFLLTMNEAEKYLTKIERAAKKNLGGWRRASLQRIPMRGVL